MMFQGNDNEKKKKNIKKFDKITIKSIKKPFERNTIDIRPRIHSKCIYFT